MRGSRGFQPAKAKPFANGGPVRGPGTGTSDQVPDEVPDGTYIMPADSTQAVGEQQLAAMGGAPRGFAPGQRKVPVQLSNGEYKLPPEQVHAIGVQALDNMKNATHEPVAARGFAPRGQRAVAGADPGQQVPVRGFSPIGRQTPVPKTFQGEPPLFFADGGVVVRGLPSRSRFANGGLVDDEQKRSNSYGDAAAAALSPGVTQVSAPAPALQPAAVSTQASAAPSPGSTFPGNRLPSASGTTSAPVSSTAPAGMTNAQRAAAIAQIPTDTMPAPAAPPSMTDGGRQMGMRGFLPGMGRSGNSAADSAASMVQSRGLPGARASIPTTPAVAPAGPQANQVMPGVYRSGNSYSDSAAGAVAGAQPRGLPSPQNMAAADAMAQRQEAAALQAPRGFAPAVPQYAAPQVNTSANDWETRNNLRNLEVSASSITNNGGRYDSRRGRIAGFSPAQDAYMEAAKADQIARAQQPAIDVATNKVNAELQGESMQQVGENQRTQLQQALADIRARRTEQHQTNQDDIARQRLALEAQKVGQGSVPSGYRARQDGRGLEFIPGGPADPGTSKEASQQTKDTQDVFSILDQARPLLGKATGSYAGALVDTVAQVGGWSTPGADAAAQLKVLQGALVSKMPKMSGPQSDKDVQLYQEMAGRIGNPNVPSEQRMAAMKSIEDLNMKYLPVAADAGAYQALQSGAYYKTPDGSVRRKK